MSNALRPIVDPDGRPWGTMPDCGICDGEGWVCEAHPRLPWEGTVPPPDCCDCGAPGMPRACTADGLVP